MRRSVLLHGLRYDFTSRSHVHVCQTSCATCAVCHCCQLLQGAPGSSGGGSSSLLPQGAIGVFDLPSHWAVVQQHAGTDEPAIDT
jgi:hypothetical protein